MAEVLMIMHWRLFFFFGHMDMTSRGKAVTVKVQGDSIKKKKEKYIQCISCGRLKGQIHRTRPSRSISAENKKVHTEHLHSGGATTWTFIVDGAKDINSFVMCSPVPRNMVVNLTTRQKKYKSLRMFTSHFMLLWKEVSWNSLAPSPMKFGCNNTST